MCASGSKLHSKQGHKNWGGADDGFPSCLLYRGAGGRRYLQDFIQAFFPDFFLLMQ